MKITAGLGSIDNYIPYMQAGADEFFCGYVPYAWTQKHGLFAPLNRREVMYYNVQIGSASEMKILRRMIDHYRVPVSLTLNSPSYSPADYPELLSYIEHCLGLGFASFIIADYDFLRFLHAQPLYDRLDIHLSGEVGEINRAMLPLIADLGVKRVIFHRKVDPSEMRSMIIVSSGLPPMTFEAFAMNEMCHFHGGFCNSLHCDELSHMCLVPYRPGAMADQDSAAVACGAFPAAEGCPDIPIDTGGAPCSLRPSQAAEGCPDVPGATGCALCSLWQLQAAGIDWLKVVSRGAGAADTIASLQALKKALRILDKSVSEESYITAMKASVFPDGCSGQCYYPLT